MYRSSRKIIRGQAVPAGVSSSFWTIFVALSKMKMDHIIRASRQDGNPHLRNIFPARLSCPCPFRLVLVHQNSREKRLPQLYANFRHSPIPTHCHRTERPVDTGARDDEGRQKKGVFALENKSEENPRTHGHARDGNCRAIELLSQDETIMSFKSHQSAQCRKELNERKTSPMTT